MRRQRTVHPTFVQFEHFALASGELMAGGGELEIYWLVGNSKQVFDELSRLAEVVPPLRQMPFGQVFGVGDPDGLPRFELRLWDGAGRTPLTRQPADGRPGERSSRTCSPRGRRIVHYPIHLVAEGRQLASTGMERRQPRRLMRSAWTRKRSRIPTASSRSAPREDTFLRTAATISSRRITNSRRTESSAQPSRAR